MGFDILKFRKEQDSLKVIEDRKKLLEISNLADTTTTDTLKPRVKNSLLVGNELDVGNGVILNLESGELIKSDTDTTIGNMNDDEEGVNQLINYRIESGWADSPVDSTNVIDNESIVSLSDLSENYMNQLKNFRDLEPDIKEAQENYKIMSTTYDDAIIAATVVIPTSGKKSLLNYKSFSLNLSNTLFLD